jgi:hypothetical protein
VKLLLMMIVVAYSFTTDRRQFLDTRSFMVGWARIGWIIAFEKDDSFKTTLFYNDEPAKPALLKAGHPVRVRLGQMIEIRRRRRRIRQTHRARACGKATLELPPEWIESWASDLTLTPEFIITKFSYDH